MFKLFLIFDMGLNWRGINFFLSKFAQQLYLTTLQIQYVNILAY